MSVLSDYEPKKALQYFEKIASIPHGSTNTKQISDYVVSFAKEHGLKYLQDKSNNVIIWKDGTKGYEESPTVMIQGHLDMVCEKEPNLEFDFEKDGLELMVEDNILTAKGTTLGADDGIAVAYALAILDSDDIKHPPLEVVFTTDEEIGMLGAAAMDTTPLKAKYMINIDSEEEGYLLVSCAGGTTAVCTFEVEREEYEGIPVMIHVKDGFGGHSGVEIDKGRANANKEMGRFLYNLSKQFDFRLVKVSGGSKDNAIPLESKAHVVFAKDTDMEALYAVIQDFNEILKFEYQVNDPNINIVLKTEVDTPYVPMTKDWTKRIITALFNMPWGIQKMSPDIEGLVQTSLNMGILKCNDEKVVCSFSVRSSVESEKNELVERIECLTDMLGGTFSEFGDYPAWQYNPDSKLREIMIEVFERQYGHKPVIQALHAGVECGLFAGKIDGLDCVSFGPDLKDVHTFNETLDLASAERTWEYLLAVLKALK